MKREMSACGKDAGRLVRDIFFYVAFYILDFYKHEQKLVKYFTKTVFI